MTTTVIGLQCVVGCARADRHCRSAPLQHRHPDVRRRHRAHRLHARRAARLRRRLHQRHRQHFAQADGRRLERPLSVGFWFSLGHSSVVFALSLLLAIGVRAIVGPVKNDGSGLHQVTNLIGTERLRPSSSTSSPPSTSSSWRAYSRSSVRYKQGRFNESELEQHLVNERGFVMRFFKKLTGSHPHAAADVRGPGCSVRPRVRHRYTEVGLPRPREVPARRAACPGTRSSRTARPVRGGHEPARHDRRQLHATSPTAGRSANPVRKVHYNIPITGLQHHRRPADRHPSNLVGLLGQEFSLTGAGSWGWTGGGA